MASSLAIMRRLNAKKIVCCKMLPKQIVWTDMNTEKYCLSQQIFHLPSRKIMVRAIKPINIKHHVDNLVQTVVNSRFALEIKVGALTTRKVE